MLAVTKEYDEFFNGTEHKTPGLLYLSVREEEKILDINYAIVEAMHILVTEESGKESADFIVNMWFKDLRLGHIVGDYCEFVTSTDLRAGIILKKYKEQMEFCLEQIIGYHCEVRIMSLTKFQRNIYNFHLRYTEVHKPRIESSEELERILVSEKASAGNGDGGSDTLEALKNDPFANKPFTVGALVNEKSEEPTEQPSEQDSEK